MANSAYSWYPMPFGRHKNMPLSQIPAAYLAWVLTSCDSADDNLKYYIKTELQARGQSTGSNGHSNNNQSNNHQSKGNQDRQERPEGRSASHLPVAVDATLAAEIVKEGRRALALRYHPDRGGDAEKMVKINATSDYLEKKLTSLLGIGGVL